MKTCVQCRKRQGIKNFAISKNSSGNNFHSNYCRSCQNEKAKLKRNEIKASKPSKKPKREPKEIIPIFINSSIVSVGACHTVKANIQNGSKIFKFEKKFDVHRKAKLFIEQINENPLLASQYINEAKKVDYRKTKVIFSI